MWLLLGKVKSEFGKFGEILDKTHEKLRQASDNIQLAQQKSRTIESKLKSVQELPSTASTPLIEEKVVDLNRDIFRDESLI